MHLDTEEHEVELLDARRQDHDKASAAGGSGAVVVEGKKKSLNDWKVTAAEYDELFEYLSAFQVADRTVKVKSEKTTTPKAVEANNASDHGSKTGTDIEDNTWWRQQKNMHNFVICKILYYFPTTSN